ncbi:MAG TPA: hypothetical protein VL691_04650 [Vicinamibacteria bacterium]|nr:hypothetical protein [Vicinamibacteria bacterium]
MTRRLAAAFLLLAALGLHLAVTRPCRRERDESRQAFAAAREERERLRSRQSRLERGAASGRAPAGDAAAARALRLSLLRATDRLPLAAVQIAVEAGRRGAVAAHGRLSAEGGQADLLRAAGRLAEPSSGVLLQRVTLLAIPGRVRLEAEASSLRAPADLPEAGS